ncbi:hypothetical protein MMN78_26705, partial [Escherichia coli]|nr:hypothetical protein [Escherichia coli]
AERGLSSLLRRVQSTERLDNRAIATRASSYSVL